MKKILIVLLGIILLIISGCHNKIESDNIKGEENLMKIIVVNNDIEIVYELNNSDASKDLYKQLPLKLEVENFSTNEKIFYPPKKLSISNTPIAKNEKGLLAYYEPWGDVVMFYDSFNSNESLYELGSIVSGFDNISNLSGTIEIMRDSGKSFMEN